MYMFFHLTKYDMKEKKYNIYKCAKIRISC